MPGAAGTGRFNADKFNRFEYIKSTTMGNSSKFLAGLIVGAAAGAAIALLLNTESGKKVLADLKDAAGKTLEDLKNAAADFAEDAETAV